MSWLVLATMALLADADPPPTDGSVVSRVAHQPVFQPPQEEAPPDVAPGLPEGVEPPQPLGRVTPRIEPLEVERPPMLPDVAEVEMEEEVQPVFSLDELIGLEDHGVSVFGTQLVDFSLLMGGGANPGGGATPNYFDLALALDSERFLSRNWTGGTFFLLFQNVGGPDASADVGDALVIDNIDLPESRTQLAEFFYEQWSLDERLRIKFGRFDANSEFSFSDHSGEFVHSGFGPQPTIFDVMPTFPDPSTAIGIFLYPHDNLSLGFAIFDGRLVEGVPTGELGPFLGGPYWIVGEVGVNYTVDCDLAGRLAVGGWGHTFGAFERLDGNGTQDGQAGLYVFLDQVLWLERPWDEEDGQGVRAFVSYGAGDDKVNTFPQAITAGLTRTGMLACRDDDVAGLGVVWGQFSDNDPTRDKDAEVALESFYRLMLTPNFSVQPVVHYVVNPGGDATTNDAWIGTIRLIAEF